MTPPVKPATFWVTVWTDDPADGMIRQLEEERLRNVHNIRAAMQKAAALVGEIDHVIEVRVRMVRRA